MLKDAKRKVRSNGTQEFNRFLEGLDASAAAQGIVDELLAQVCELAEREWPSELFLPESGDLLYEPATRIPLSLWEEEARKYAAN